MQKLKNFIKKEAVLSAAALLALISAFFVPPDGAYIGYIDFKVLAVLFCLMAVVAGLEHIGVFRALGGALAARIKRPKTLILALTLLCFFISPFITNDVTLITFVPFTVLLLGGADSGRLIFAIVAETVAANLGSLITPFGNPQNLYIFSRYQMTTGEFFAVTLPLGGVCLALTLAFAAFAPAGGEVRFERAHEKIPAPKLAVYLALFALCILGVFGLVSWPLLLGAVAVYMLAFDRGLFRRVDYSLLITFVCFFIFVGNVSRIDAAKALLSSLIEGRTVLVSALVSQAVSNVPAATLLSAFTEDARGLIIGTNAGGLGTPIASMASLISYRLYCASPSPERGRYMAVFLSSNAVLLAVLLFICLLVF